MDEGGEDMDDQKLMMLLYDRAEGAIEAISNAYGSRLYSIASNILGNHQDAEESLNDTYLALWNAIPPKKPNPLIAYACRVIRNIALNRRRGSDSKYDLSLEELSGCLPASSIEEVLDARALGRAINAFLDTLPSVSRSIFLRRYWFGDSVKEIASAFSMTESAVSVRLNRIRAKLRLHLAKEEIL